VTNADEAPTTSRGAWWKGPQCSAAIVAGWTTVTTAPDPEATGSYGDFISPIPNSKHVMGTVRMGDDPATSVVDRWGRFHDVPNLMVADSSVFVTSAGYGPTLTLVTLALRNARALAEAG